MERIPESERTRDKLRALMEGQSEATDGRSELVRLAARLIIEEALEGEARDAVGRDYYARGARPGAGYRNGYRRGRVPSAEGAIECSAPQITDREEPFRSRIREVVRGRTEQLESLAVEMYARGLSTRDIEAVFAGADGRSLLSRTAVSEVTERLWAEYEAFASRDLSEFAVIYLFVDGIAERLHLGQPREAVLAAWGILADGKKALLHLAPGTAARSSFRRCAGAACRTRSWWPSTGHPASSARSRNACRARCASAAWRTRCETCKARCPRTSGRSSRRRRGLLPGGLAALAHLLRNDIATTFETELPSAVACLDDDFEACIAHLRFPLGHRRAIRSTNLLERLFGEARRRTKVIPHAFGERAVLKLMYAALIRAAERWRGIKITEFEQRQLKAIREEIDRDFTARNAPISSTTVTAAPTRLSSKDRT